LATSAPDSQAPVREYFGDATAVPDIPPRKPPPEDEREVDYLICRQCGSPCYVFEMDKGKIQEAQCMVCGNDDILQFNIGEEKEDE
jgi:hypothetical protein